MNKSIVNCHVLTHFMKVLFLGFMMSLFLIVGCSKETTNKTIYPQLLLSTSEIQNQIIGQWVFVSNESQHLCNQNIGGNHDEIIIWEAMDLKFEKEIRLKNNSIPSCVGSYNIADKSLEVKSHCIQSNYKILQLNNVHLTIQIGDNYVKYRKM
jgi:hypothetical protein